MTEIDPMKKWIDSQSYESLLRKWRYAPSGDPMFIGEIGDYYIKVMTQRKKELSTNAQVNISKSIGWEN